MEEMRDHSLGGRSGHRSVSEVPIKVAETGDPELRSLLFIAGRILRELLLGGNIILNITVPTAVATVRGMGSAKELAAIAEKAAGKRLGKWPNWPNESPG